MNFLRQITEGKYIYTFIFFNGTLKFQYIRVLRRRLLLRHVKTDNLTRTQLMPLDFGYLQFGFPFCYRRTPPALQMASLGVTSEV